MPNIDNMSPRSGRILQDDDTIINIADLTGGIDFTFHDGASASGNGSSKTIKGEKFLRAGIKQNSTNSIVECHGVDASGNDELIKGFDRAFDEYDNTTASAITLSYDVSAYKSVYFKTVANNIMIKGVFTA